MGKYDESADRAEQQTDELLEADLARLSSIDDNVIESLPESSDREAMKNLISDVDSATNDNERKNAMKTFTAVATAGAVALARKVLLPAFLILATALPSFATILDLKPPLQWMQDRTQLIKTGAAIRLRRNSSDPLTVGIVNYMPIFWSKNDRWDVGIGHTHFEGGEDKISPAIGINFVGLLKDLWKSKLKDKMNMLDMPNLWIGVALEAPSLNRLQDPWVIGDNAVVHFAWRLF